MEKQNLSAFHLFWQYYSSYTSHLESLFHEGTQLTLPGHLMALQSLKKKKMYFPFMPQKKLLLLFFLIPVHPKQKL